MKTLVIGSLVLLAAGAQPMLAAEVRTLPPAVYAQMKSGSKLGSIWISPKFDGAKGFRVGQVDVAPELEDPHKNVIDYIPYALRRIATVDSPYVMTMTMVDVDTVDRGSIGYFSAAVGVEGQIKDQDGTLLVAFRTREQIQNRETVEKNLLGSIDRIVWAISRDLGKSFLHALEVRKQLVEGVDPSGLVPPAPPAPEAPLDIQGRLLRLDDLLKKGLITPEEYKTHKEEILKGL